MNNMDFKQHFINAIHQTGIREYQNISVTIEPVQEKNKGYNTYDDIMRLRIIPNKRTVDFDEAVLIFTQEGYYPCWIEISELNGGIYLRTSLRMRKAGTKDDKVLYPFSVNKAAP